MRSLTIVLSGCLFSLLVLLPLDEFTLYYEYHFSADRTVGQFVAQQLWKSFSLDTPVKLVFYLTFGVLLGVAGHMLMAALVRRNTSSCQLESELGKDLGTLIGYGEDDNLEFKSSFRYNYRQQNVNQKSIRCMAESAPNRIVRRDPSCDGNAK
jgi:hypothetical protein